MTNNTRITKLKKLGKGLARGLTNLVRRDDRSKPGKSKYKLVESHEKDHLFHLDVNISGTTIQMCPSTGCPASFLSWADWPAIGCPTLNKFTKKGFHFRRVQDGARVPILGQFVARVFYKGRMFEAPVLVFKNEKSWDISFIGRSWLLDLNIDWNDVFRCQEEIHSWSPTPPSIDHGRDTLTSSIRVKLNGTDVDMKFITGQSSSVINQKVWKLLGCPPLKPTVATNRNTGRFMVTAQYNGEEHRVPLTVVDVQRTSSIGTDWFTYFEFDFNVIIYNLIKYED